MTPADAQDLPDSSVRCPVAESEIAVKLRECLALVEAEDRIQVRALQDRIAELEHERQRFGGLVAEVTRQVKPLARQAVAGNPDRLTELTALTDRIRQMANAYAAGRDWTAREDDRA